MSTVKTDVITAVSTNGDLSLDGLGSGGVSIASTLKMTKGGDIASASPLVIDTDGNYFDVTGTTNFAAMTVEAGNFFMLQFDGALTITHGSGIELPGAANLTTAAGDRLICYATAADTVEVMNVATEAAAAGGATGVAARATFSTSSTVSITGFDSSTYDAYKIFLYITPSNNDRPIHVRTSTDGGSSYDSGGSDYGFTAHGRQTSTGANAPVNVGDQDASSIKIIDNSLGGNHVGSDAGESAVIEITMIRPDALNNTYLQYVVATTSEATAHGSFRGSAERYSAADVDGVQVYASTGTITGSYLLIGYKVS